MARLALAALTASAALLVGATTPSAATVDNPGPFTATFDSGELSVLDGAALVPLPAPGTVSGSIDGDGAIASPASGGRAIRACCPVSTRTSCAWSGSSRR